MKKLNILILILTLMPTFLIAQIRYGVTSGVNFSGFIGNDARNMTHRTGFSAGAFLEYPITEYFSFIPQLLYSVKGANSPAQMTLFTTAKKIRGGTPNVSPGSGSVDFGYDVDEKYEYLDIPLLLNYSLKFNNTKRVMVFLGPSAGILLRAQYLGKSATSGSVVDAKQSIPDQKKLDLGFVFGTGFGFEVLKHEAAVSFRYGFGFSPIDDSANAYDIKNNYYSVMAGVWF